MANNIKQAMDDWGGCVAGALVALAVVAYVVWVFATAAAAAGY